VSSIEKLRYHLVWCTKYRYKLLTGRAAEALKNLLQKNQEKYGFKIISLAIESDHVHLLFSVKSSQEDLNKIVKKIKGYSSFFLRKNFTRLCIYPALWTSSHFLASCGDVSKETIRKYIDSQGLEEKEIVKRTFIYKVFSPNKRKVEQLSTWLKNINCRPKGLQQDRQRKYPDRIVLRNDLIKIEKKDNGQLWLHLPGGNGWKSIWIRLVGRAVPEDARVKDSYIRNEDGTWKVYLSIEQERIIKNHAHPTAVEAIDLGISHPATKIRLESGHLASVQYIGAELKDASYRRAQRLAKLASVGVKNLKRKVIKLTNRKNDIVHQITAEIIKAMKSEVLVVGNLRGITKTWDRKKKKRNKNFRKKAKPTPYGKLMSQLWYKGTLAGKQVVFQDEAWTSKRCSRCGELGCRTNEWFECKVCGYQNQADLNGAVNIALAYLLGTNGSPFEPLGRVEREMFSVRAVGGDL